MTPDSIPPETRAWLAERIERAAEFRSPVGARRAPREWTRAEVVVRDVVVVSRRARA